MHPGWVPCLLDSGGKWESKPGWKNPSCQMGDNDKQGRPGENDQEGDQKKPQDHEAGLNTRGGIPKLESERIKTGSRGYGSARRVEGKKHGKGGAKGKMKKKTGDWTKWVKGYTELTSKQSRKQKGLGPGKEWKKKMYH